MALPPTVPPLTAALSTSVPHIPAAHMPNASMSAFVGRPPSPGPRIATADPQPHNHSHPSPRASYALSMSKFSAADPSGDRRPPGSAFTATGAQQSLPNGCSPGSPSAAPITGAVHATDKIRRTQELLKGHGIDLSTLTLNKPRDMSQNPLLASYNAAATSVNTLAASAVNPLAATAVNPLAAP